MAPPSKYRNRYSTNVDMERDLKDFADFFGIKLSYALQGGLKYLISQQMCREDIPSEIKLKWADFLVLDAQTHKDAIFHLNNVVRKGTQSGEQKRIQEYEENKLIWVWDEADRRKKQIREKEFDPDFHRRYT